MIFIKLWVLLIGLMVYNLTAQANNHLFNHRAARLQVVKVTLPVFPETQEYGTGIILGYHQQQCVVATAYHLIKKANRNKMIRLTLQNGKVYLAQIKQSLPKIDVTILTFPSPFQQCPSIKFADRLEVASDVYALGNANNQGIALSKGIVSRLSFFDQDFLIETDALATQGSSGGGLFNANGELVGMINSVSMNRYGGISGFSYATPQSVIRKAWIDIQNYNQIRVINLGFTVKKITRLRQHNSTIEKELLIQTVTNNTLKKVVKGGNEIVALNKGNNYLEGGDILLKVNNQAVYDDLSLNYILATIPYQQQITLTLKRKNKVFLQSYFSSYKLP